METIIALFRSLLKAFSFLIMDSGEEADFRSPKFDFTKFVFTIFVTVMACTNVWLTSTFYRGMRLLHETRMELAELSLTCQRGVDYSIDSQTEVSTDRKSPVVRSFNSPPPPSPQGWYGP